MNNLLNEFRSTNITWDKATSRIYSPVTANASDENGRKLVVQIVNSGQVEDLTGATLHLYWETRDKLHDGLDVFKAVDLKKGEFELSYTTGMLSNKGVLNANLVLIDTVGRVVSERFKITVTEGVDNDAIQSENSFSSLTQALIDISNLEQKYAPRLSTLEQNDVSLSQQLQQTEQSLTAQLAQTEQKIKTLGTFISIKKFISPSDVTHTKAFRDAVAYADTNNVDIYVDGGSYYIDDVVDINKKVKILFSIKSMVYAKTTGTVFKASALDVILDGPNISASELIYRNQYTGIHVTNARCSILNPNITRARKGILCDTESYQTKLIDVLLSYCTNAVEFGRGSAGSYMTIKHLVGPAGYSNTVDDGSIGVIFNTANVTIGNGGQIDSFASAIDCNAIEITIGRVYSENNYRSFTDTSKGEINYNVHDANVRNFAPDSLVKITPSGYGFATVYNRADIKHTIPVNDLLGYYIFDEIVNGKIRDYSGNMNHLSINTLVTSDTRNIFGKSIRLSSDSGKKGVINLNGVDLNKPITFVYSLKSEVNSSTARLMSITPSGLQSPEVYTVMPFTDAVYYHDGAQLHTFLGGHGSNQSSKYNSFHSATFDFKNNKVIQQQIHNPNKVENVIDGSKFINGISSIGILQSFPSEPHWIDFNYIMIFNGDLNREQLSAIQNNEGLILTPKFLTTTQTI